MSHGHGHVTEGPLMARCGGPAICATCKQEWYQKYGANWPYESEVSEQRHDAVTIRPEDRDAFFQEEDGDAGN